MEGNPARLVRRPSGLGAIVTSYFTCFTCPAQANLPLTFNPFLSIPICRGVERGRILAALSPVPFRLQPGRVQQQRLGG